MNDLSEVKEDIRSVVEKLISVRHQMAGIQESVPPGVTESSLEDCDADPDIPTEIRAVLGTCLVDALDPMIRDLNDLLAYQPGKPELPCEASQE